VRTTIELDDDLVARARAHIAAPTLRALIELSLREAIQVRAREDLLAALRTGGAIDLTDEEFFAGRDERPE
jgi:Arc/MetJ family transcription regulator